MISSMNFFLGLNPHFSQAICCEAGTHCVYFVALEKHPQHTVSMPAGVFRRAPRIHNPFQLLATTLVRNAAKDDLPPKQILSHR